MTPEAVAEKQIELYRRMSGEERMAIAFGLHALACEMARAGIRRQHPDIDEIKVERFLRTRLGLVHGS